MNNLFEGLKNQISTFCICADSKTNFCCLVTGALCFISYQSLANAALGVCIASNGRLKICMISFINFLYFSKAIIPNSAVTYFILSTVILESLQSAKLKITSCIPSFLKNAEKNIMQGLAAV